MLDAAKPEPVTLNPRQRKKDEYELALVIMPDGENLKEGCKNRLRIGLRYLKDGMGRQGRGIYLSLTGHTKDGMFESHMLMQDPSHYILIEPMKRFSAKKLEALLKDLGTDGGPHADTIAEYVAAARNYYELRRAV